MLAWIRSWFEPRFQPRSIYNSELRLTAIILEDVPTVWCPWGPYQGHAVDVGYAMDDDRLVGIKVWDDIRTRHGPTRPIVEGAELIRKLYGNAAQDIRHS